ncbi:hypothetical protein CVT24_008026 [Panaeolus cyanescens]|uniref:DNA mismatch repair proteins mutS family domain-containing protein n=1 Tax=Panaeolus cyanescens TaxID=181874 RepID=A0A409YQZ2_9AGAR|nr:hypothetical protein CVT24_008026 [Panaeolus cyanescens]
MTPVIEQVSPDVILTSSKSDDKIINLFNDHAEQTHTAFQIRPFKEFIASKGRERLLSLNKFTELQADEHSGPPSSENGTTSKSNGFSFNAEAFMHSRQRRTGDPTLRQWSASIRLANFAAVESANLCMSSVGALLDFIVRERALADFDDEGLVGLEIKDIQILALDQFMQINADALASGKLIESLDVPALKDMGVKIDWEESTNNDRVCVRPGIDEDLDNRKHVYHGIDSILSNVAQQISETVPPHFAVSLNVVYFPQLGYLISVPMMEEWRNEEGIQPLPGWSFQFASDAHVYFKSEQMQDLDTHIGDLHSTIIDRELELIQVLLEDLVACENDINKACETKYGAGEHHRHHGREASFCRNLLLFNPNYLLVVRHPLHEQIVDTFVANDVKLMGGLGLSSTVERPSDEGKWNSIALCTGANACGKSVYLKQVALIQIMAQSEKPYISSRSFVPAASANLGITDKIFTRVSTKESVSKAQSAFMIDLAQVSLALRNCTVRSIIILDEFGKDGAGLFCGVLRHLLNRGAVCPKVLVASHFHDIFNEGLLDPEQVPISFYHMQVMFTTNASEALESHSLSGLVASSVASVSELTHHMGIESRLVNPRSRITYLYKVAEGLSLHSHAIHCAETFGVPTRVVERARHVSSLLVKHEIGRLLDEDMTQEERQALEDAEAVCRRFLAWDLGANDAAYRAKYKLGQVLGDTMEDDQ